MINDEIDLLEIRMNTLYPFVEKFVVVEAEFTHSGKHKGWNFNKDRFERFASKIIYLQHPGYYASNIYEAWGNENVQRNKILEALKIAQPKDGLLFVSDADEIPKPEKLIEAKCIACTTGMPVALNMHYCMYYLNYAIDTPFRGAFLYKPEEAQRIQKLFKCERYSPTDFRWQIVAAGHENDYPNLNEAGWHFSTAGGIEKIKNKLRSYAHLEYNTPEIVSEDYLNQCIFDGVPYFEKLNKTEVRFSRRELDFLPEYVRVNADRYKEYIL